MKAIIIAMTFASALTIIWLAENLECLLYPGMDTCVGCIDDCLDPEDPPTMNLVTEYVKPEPICFVIPDTSFDKIP